MLEHDRREVPVEVKARLLGDEVANTDHHQDGTALDAGHDQTTLEISRGPAWSEIIEVEETDPLTGELVPPEELRFRMRILEDARRGLYAVDAEYEALRGDIHKPLAAEN